MKHLILIIIISVFQMTVAAQSEVTSSDNYGISQTVNQENNFDLKIFPNPTKIQKVTLTLNSDEISEIHLINIVGKEILTKKFQTGVNKYKLRLKEIPNGVYLIQVKTSGNKAIVKKLLVSSN